LNRFGAKAVQTAVLVIDCPGVMPLVGERVAAGVAQHARVRLDLEAGSSRHPLDQANPAVVNGDSWIGSDKGSSGKMEGPSPRVDSKGGWDQREATVMPGDHEVT
jgi:hypothetical protein